ncbi:MAG TPA: tripartite tricarboxylate transporter substrate binding protein [Burkholderiales bacterium]|nr:tripartite tricarboxylate transporter substrate binding protein [Burkholderiales bacterium]
MRSGTISVARAVFLFLSGWLALTATAYAQYPNRMVRAIVPYTPGSSADLIARNLGPRLSESWKVPFVVDNRAGASGIIGVQAVVAAPGDGYTVLIMADNFASAASVRRNSYDPVNDLDPVILLARGEYALMASASFPAKSVAELVVMARANPGKIYYASPGSGLPAHLMMEVFKSTMGIDLVHVPYKNNAAAVTDLLGGQVSLMFASVGVALPLAEGGRIRILAAGAAKRAARTPEVPSFIESGVKDFNVGTWFAMLVPKGTPREVRARLHADVAVLLKEPAVTELMLKQGMTPAGGTPEELHDLIRSDFERWNKIVHEANIKAD